MRNGLRQPCAVQRPVVNIWFLGSGFALPRRGCRPDARFSSVCDFWLSVAPCLIIILRPSLLGNHRFHRNVTEKTEATQYVVRTKKERVTM